MAKPDCDDGWYKKSIELEAALGYADFTMLAQTILRYVFCQIFGQGNRPRYAVLVTSELAARMKKPKQHVHRAMQELLASKVLVPVEGQKSTYRFVKDYEKWVMVARLKGDFYPTDRPRLDEHEVADCLDAPAYSRSFARKTNTDESVINLDDFSDASENAESSIEMTKSHQSRLLSVIQIDDRPLDTYRIPLEEEKPTSACDGKELRFVDEEGIGFALNSNTENTEKKRKRSDLSSDLRGGDRRSLGTDCEPEEPFIPAEVSPPIQAAPSEPTPADLAAAWAMERVSRAYPGDDSLAELAFLQAGSWVRDQGYAPAAVQAAIVKTIGAKVRGGGFLNYAGKVIQSRPPESQAPSSAVLPSQTRPMTYHTASPRPKPPRGPEGVRS